MFRSNGMLSASVENAHGFDPYGLDILALERNGIDIGRQLRTLRERRDHLTSFNDLASGNYDVRAFLSAQVGRAWEVLSRAGRDSEETEPAAQQCRCSVYGG